MPENKEVRKLELCDIAPYAPFDLPVKILNSERDSVGIEESVMTGYYFLGDSLHITYKGGATGKSVSEFKPYLRSLDQLTQEITHNGVTFIPIVELAKIAESDHFTGEGLTLNSENGCFGCGWSEDNDTRYGFMYISDFNGFYLESKPYKQLVMANQRLLFQKLYEWMFDLNSLIPSGLAIPIHNTK